MTVNENTLTTHVETLIERDEITRLVYRLGECLDDGRFEEMHSLFVEDATASTPGGVAEGRDAVVAQASRNHRPEDGIQHVITNVLVDLDGDRAKVRANLVVYFAPRDDSDEPALAPPVGFILGEVYRFDGVRTAGGWRLARVETIPVWMSGTPNRGARSS